MPKSYLREVFPNLHTPENLTIFYEVKADLSDADLAVLAEARVHSLQPGIEALATSTLKLMKKGTSGSGNVRFLQGLRPPRHLPGMESARSDFLVRTSASTRPTSAICRC